MVSICIQCLIVILRTCHHVLNWTGNTVKHAYSEHAYNELTVTAMWFSFPVGFKHILKPKS